MPLGTAFTNPANKINYNHSPTVPTVTVLLIINNSITATCRYTLRGVQLITKQQAYNLVNRP